MALMPLILMLNKFYTLYDDPKQEKCLGNQGLQFLILGHVHKWQEHGLREKKMFHGGSFLKLADDDV